VNLEEKLQRVRDTITAAESRYHRPPGSVRLIGASKVQATEKIRKLVELGLEDIGESYLQEALLKQAQLADLNVRWHFIGKIQSNKTRDIARNFSWVHSVDRLKVARQLSKHKPPHTTDINICLQLNLQHEVAKGGLDEDEVDDIAAEVSKLPGLKLRGLMAIPQPTSNFDMQRQIYRHIHAIFDRLQGRGFTLDTLSMGMTGDMEAAIAEGSTMVRIGTALFGPRPAKPV